MKLISFVLLTLLFSCNKGSNLTSLISNEAKVKFKIDLISYGNDKESFRFLCFDQKKLDEYQEKANLAFLNSKKFEEKAPEPTFKFEQKYNRSKTIEFEAKLPKIGNTCKIIYGMNFFGKTTYFPKDITFSKDKEFAKAFIPSENSNINISYNGYNGNIYPTSKYENIELILNDKK